MIDIEIKDKKECMGCYACANICPQKCVSMKSDEEGFWYPKVDYNDCIRCSLCISVCPTLNKKKVKNDPRAYACNNKDESVRLESSSGGIFSLVAEQVIDNDGIVFGVGFDRDFKVSHSYVEKKEEINRFRGSKYVQSKIGDSYEQVKDFLKEGRKVLFTGTPCQISGLKSYLGKKYDNLFCMDNICHGVPSPKVWDRYLSYRKKEVGSTPSSITFRSKNEGWKLFSVSFLLNNNEEYRETFRKNLYMRAFLKDISLRPSCYACEFKTLNRESDITLADFWGIQNILPEMDDDKGTSLIFINSDIGKAMLEKIKDRIEYKEVNIDQAVSYNSAAIKSVEYNLKRGVFFEELDQLEFDKLVNKYCTDKLQVRMKRKFISMGVIVLKKTGTFDLAKRMLKRN